MIELLYGTSGLRLDLPPGVRATIIAKPSFPEAPSDGDVVRTALADPIGCRPLTALAARARSACVLICDVTRPVPNHLFLRPMIETMIEAGMPAERITVLVATGLHRPNEGAELEALVGDPWVLANVRVENHFAMRDSDHVDLGFTPGRKVPVKLDRRLVEADLRIATGLVEPHFMAGYSGGRKVVAPGVAHHETIRTFHSARFMEDPLAVQCNLDGNPLHEEQLAIVRMLGECYALNTVIDDRRRLVHATFGEIIQSHLAAVAFARNFTEVPVGRRFSTVVTSSAGSPLDRTYYQTVKGMVTPLDILKPGGTLIVASECSEGFGSREFRASQERLIELGPEGYLATLLSKRLADVDEWSTEMQLRPMRVARIQLFTTGLGPDELRLTGVEPVADLRAAVAAAVQRHGDPDIAVIPEGPYVVPQARRA